MKKLIPLTLVASLLSPISSSAQETSGPAIVLPTAMPCNTAEFVLEKLDKEFQEKPVGLANGVVYGADGTPRPGQMVIWKNNSTTTFTVTFTPQGTDLMCFVLTGKDLEFLSTVLGDAI